ncbi:MAG: hypothetical protein K0Q60_2252 [Microvirga sp.]|nr:hypothetical protein [Microvirga sp.]
MEARAAAGAQVARPLVTLTQKLGQLSQILQNTAPMKCQFDAFAEYVAEAERQGGESDCAGSAHMRPMGFSGAED